MTIFLPRNLELATLIYNNPPSFKPYKTDKLRYIIHLITIRSQFKKDLLCEEYVPLNAQLLQKKIQNYAQYLTYLIDDLKILESDNYYVPGIKSKGFRLVDTYRKSKVRPITVQDIVLRKALKIDKNKIDNSVAYHGYITKWFSIDKLKIDLPLVHHFLNEELQLKLGNSVLWDTDRMSKKKKLPWNQFNHAYISAENLNSGIYHLLMDRNVGRFHSNLTNMRSVVRNAITYDGQKLVSVDIRNSQPYLSTALFRKEFWSPSNNHDKASLNNSFLRTEDDAFLFYKGLININNIYNNEKDSHIMLGENALDLENKDFSKYTDLVVEGQLYDFLEAEFGDVLGKKYCSRQDVKAAVFQVLFTDNRFIGQKEAAPKKMFQMFFPDVYEVFARIKAKDSTLLPRLLQKIESHLIINVIAKRISKEYPGAPIFTIHDSIATTEKYSGQVSKIMREELTKAIGHAPILQPEIWDTQNIYDSLNNLEKRIKVVA